MLEAAEGGEGILNPPRNFGFHLLRIGAGLGQGDSDGGQVQIREILDRQGAKAPYPGGRQQHEEQDGRNRVAD